METVAELPLAAELVRHRPQLLKFALMLLRDRAHAQDAVQETLLAALDAAGRFTGQSSLRTWLFGILKHKITDHFRREGREARAEWREEDDAAEEIDRMFLADGHFRDVPSAWPDPETALERRQFMEALERGLERLPPRTARVFRLREVMGLEIDEICRALGITRSNCSVMLHRARLMLRQHLEAHWARGRMPL